MEGFLLHVLSGAPTRSGAVALDAVVARSPEGDEGSGLSCPDREEVVRMAEYDARTVEEKWNRRWEETGLYHVDLANAAASLL